MTVHDRGSARALARVGGETAANAPTAVTSAVILAAGAGSRLRLDGSLAPKPLVTLFGRTLIERAVLRSRRAGVDRFVVVIGHEADRLSPVLDGLADRLDVTIEAIDNPGWRGGNGLSALAAAPLLDEDDPFFLMMCDHVFPTTFFDRLAAHDDGATCTVVAERSLEAVSDLEEAMKLATEGELVRRIGKDLTAYDAVDTGVFLCRPGLFDALREAQAAGDDALCAGVQRLAERGEARWVDSAGLFWQDIDTPEDLARARTGLARNPVFATDRYADLAGG
jgi:choline kinase